MLLTIALLTLAIAMLIWLPHTPSPGMLLLSLVSLIVADVALVLMFGDYLLRGLFIKPVTTMAGEAEVIAAGDYSRRLEPTGADELRRLAESVNGMADRLITNQAQLQENIRSLDSTNQELSLARRELIQSEKLATVGRLAAGIAHEVGNPLGAIVGYLEVARRRGGEDPEEWVEGVAHEAERIDRVVRSLLDFARPAQAYSQEIRVNESARKAIALLENQGHFKNIRVELDSEEPSPVVLGDPTHLEQILVNLLLNAGDAIREASAPGRVVVRTRARSFEEVRPHEPARRAEDPDGVDYSHLRRHRRSPQAVDRFEVGQPVVSIDVTDNGTGIDPDQMDSIFEPFYTTKEPGRGSGLGLAVSARLAEQMGGAMAAECEQEIGTRFALVLPSASPATRDSSIEGVA